MDTKEVMNVITHLYKVGAIADFNWEPDEVEKEVSVFLKSAQQCVQLTRGRLGNFWTVGYAPRN